MKTPDQKTCSFAEYRNWVIVNFLLGTGCCASTLVNLKIEDINFSDGTVLFRHMKTRNQQVVPSYPGADQNSGRVPGISDGAPSDLLFVSEYGVQLTVSALGNAVWAYNHKRGVEKTSVHLFRHTYASCTSKLAATRSGSKSFWATLTSR